jgi:hypothetical protein
MFENGNNMIPLAAILSIGEKVLDKVLPNPEAKAEAQAKLMEMAQRGELAQLEAQVKEMQWSSFLWMWIPIPRTF